MSMADYGISLKVEQFGILDFKNIKKLQMQVTSKQKLNLPFRA